MQSSTPFAYATVVRSATMAKRKNPAAVALGRLGGLKAAGAGARAFFSQMTEEERRAFARRAALARWAKKKRRRQA
jgi:hypothetical protein